MRCLGRVGAGSDSSVFSSVKVNAVPADNNEVPDPPPCGAAILVVSLDFGRIVDAVSCGVVASSFSASELALVEKRISDDDLCMIFANRAMEEKGAACVGKIDRGGDERH